jgi:5-methylcytosine-specific restriction endonuclease McrA
MKAKDIMVTEDGRFYRLYGKTKHYLIARICEYCGEEFFTSQSAITKGYGKYCSHTCARKLGEPVNSFTLLDKEVFELENGKLYIEYSARIYGVIKECARCGCDCFVTNAQLKDKNYCSHTCALTKEEADKVTPLRKSIRTCKKYRAQRASIFKRDDYTCQICGERSGALNAHHVKRFGLICDENNIQSLEEALVCQELWDNNNLVTLCEKCHQDVHRGSRDDYDEC